VLGLKNVEFARGKTKRKTSQSIVAIPLAEEFDFSGGFSLFFKRRHVRCKK
jgi:hypothetical protein